MIGTSLIKAIAHLTIDYLQPAGADRYTRNWIKGEKSEKVDATSSDLLLDQLMTGIWGTYVSGQHGDIPTHTDHYNHMDTAQK